jgi:RHS repeat-associated protein
VGAPSPIQRHQYGNHLGSASLELDEAAAVISYEEFHPFGTTSYAANDAGIEVSTKRYRYIGKERDEETGLYHLGARYYASWLGRWTAADPIGLGDGVNRYAYARGRPLIVVDPSGTSGELLGDLLERQMALAIDLNRATTDPQREIIAEEMLGVNREVAAELTRLNTQARAEQSIAASDVSERVRLASSTRTQASMSTGAPDDVYTRASDPKDLVRAELAQMKGLGRLANVAFQKGSARLESWGVVEPMSDNERRVRALSAGDMMDTLTDLPAGGAGRRIEIHRDGRPLKNRSGDLDDSSRARRTQPHGVDAPAEERAPLPSGLGTKVSQRQLRHVKGRQEWIDRGEGSYLHSMNDAQAVLDAVHNGTARVLGTTRQGHVVVEFEGVTGFNNNPGAGFVDQPTNVFMIKGTAKPSVVPTSPGWKPPTSR